jgi:dihydroorotate dehydrogenase electron transfer subunit
MPLDVAAEVLANARLSSDFNVLSLAAPEIAREARPGQFVMVKPAAGLDPLLRRPFSIFEILRDHRGEVRGLSLLNKSVGVGTRRLFDARSGDRIEVLGPLGRPFVPVDPPEEAWMVAGGVGLAPFATLAEALKARGTAMTLFYGARSGQELYCEDFFQALGARIVLTTEDGSRGHRGRVTEPLTRELAEREGRAPVTLYVCGPTPMMRAVAGLAARNDRAAFVSLEPVMGCGMGGCYSCVIPVQNGAKPHFVRSCLEGPVFDAAHVVWDNLAATGH